MRVILLRGYAAQIWARYPNATQGSVEQSMSEHADRIGATYSDLMSARVNLSAVREDSPDPPTPPRHPERPAKCTHPPGRPAPSQMHPPVLPTRAQLEAEAEGLAQNSTLHTNARDAWKRVKRGELQGTILASRLSRLFFLLESFDSAPVSDRQGAK